MAISISNSDWMYTRRRVWSQVLERPNWTAGLRSINLCDDR